MNFTELVNAIAKKEGKKDKAHIGNIREITRIISELMAKDPKVTHALLSNGLKNLAKKKN